MDVNEATHHSGADEDHIRITDYFDVVKLLGSHVASLE